mgnify:CR=1 FL=1
MIVPDIFFSLLIAIILSAIFTWILRRGSPRSGFFIFFLTLFVTTWAGGVWIRQAGWNLPAPEWLPFVVTGIVFAIILMLLAPKTPKIDKDTRLDRKQTIDMLDELEVEHEMEELAYISMNVFFWCILALFVAALIYHYVG